MSRNNKFGFGPMGNVPAAPKRDRAVGPMGAAVRETAGSLQDSTDALAEQRRRNSRDAKAYSVAREDGLVLERVALNWIGTDDLPRDRLDLEDVANSDEMEELKASIRTRGQREPVELYRDSAGRFQIKKGWRRFTALCQLLAETGDETAFGTIIARIEAEGEGDRMARYIDMVEENIIREDLSFAEMALVAISAARDSGIEGADPEDLVVRLYGSLHKMKRSYIKSFVKLLKLYEADLKFPKAVPRNLGVDVVRKSDGEASNTLRKALQLAETAQAQNDVLRGYVTRGITTSKRIDGHVTQKPVTVTVGNTKAEVKNGRLTLSGKMDYSAASKGELVRAIKAFDAELKSG